jgi:hypothetical protein
MYKTSTFAALTLLPLIAIAPHVQAQGAPTKAAEAVRQQKLKAAQAATVAAARANAAATKPVAAINRPIPTAIATPRTVATTPPVTSAARKPAVTAPAASSRVKPVTSAGPATRVIVPLPTHADTAAIALDLDALKKTRPDRRHAEFLGLQARFGALLSDPRATAELKQHAQRIAHLERVRALGVKANDANFVKGVDATITTEEARDANTLNALRTSALPVAVAAAATAVAVPVATAQPAGGAK